MENIILTLIITLALLFIVIKAAKGLKGLAQNDYEKDCSGCGCCCKSDCESKSKLIWREK